MSTEKNNMDDYMLFAIIGDSQKFLAKNLERLSDLGEAKIFFDNNYLRPEVTNHAIRVIRDLFPEQIILGENHRSGRVIFLKNKYYEQFTSSFIAELFFKAAKTRDPLSEQKFKYTKAALFNYPGEPYNVLIHNIFSYDKEAYVSLVNSIEERFEEARIESEQKLEDAKKQQLAKKQNSEKDSN